MEKKSARLFQRDRGRNIVELEVLESRRHLRLNVNELIRLANNATITTGEMQQQLFLGVSRFGTQLAAQLVRSLHRDDSQERQAIVWLLTLLNAKETITPLRHMSHDERIPRSIRLSASLALAGMGVTADMIDNHRCTRLYAIS
ncbi:MAG TPA: hypothetical protein VF844_01945 [Ktedonobacteraceae bacterium]